MKYILIFLLPIFAHAQQQWDVPYTYGDTLPEIVVVGHVGDTARPVANILYRSWDKIDTVPWKPYWKPKKKKSRLRYGGTMKTFVDPGYYKTNRYAVLDTIRKGTPGTPMGVVNGRYGPISKDSTEITGMHYIGPSLDSLDMRPGKYYWCQIEVIRDTAREKFFKKHPNFTIPSGSGDLGLVYGCSALDTTEIYIASLPYDQQMKYRSDHAWYKSTPAILIYGIIIGIILCALFLCWIGRSLERDAEQFKE